MDGVLNNQDDCPDTEDDYEVDQSGCAANQRDTDNDGLNDEEEQNLGTDPNNSDTDDQFFHHVLTVSTTDYNIDEWDEKFKIIINATDHSSNPTVNAKIGSDAPVIIATISAVSYTHLRAHET